MGVVVWAAVLYAVGACRDEPTVKCVPPRAWGSCFNTTITCDASCPCNIMCYGESACNGVRIRCPPKAPCNIAVFEPSSDMRVDKNENTSCYASGGRPWWSERGCQQVGVGHSSGGFWDASFIANYGRPRSPGEGCPGVGMWTASCTRDEIPASGHSAGVVCSPEELQPHCKRRLSGKIPQWDPPGLPRGWWDSSGPKPMPDCKHHEGRTYVTVRGEFGRSNNALIGFANLVMYVARAPERYTLVVPNWYLKYVDAATFDYVGAVKSFACIVGSSEVPIQAKREHMKALFAYWMKIKPWTRGAIFASMFSRPSASLRDSVAMLDEMLAQRHRQLVGPKGPPYAGVYAAIHLRDFQSELYNQVRGKYDPVWTPRMREGFWSRYVRYNFELKAWGIERIDADRMTNEYLDKVLGNLKIPVYLMCSPYGEKEGKRIIERYKAVSAPRNSAGVLDSLMAFRSAVFVFNILSSMSLNVVLAREALDNNTITSWVASSRLEPTS